MSGVPKTRASGEFVDPPLDLAPEGGRSNPPPGGAPRSGTPLSGRVGPGVPEVPEELVQLLVVSAAAWTGFRTEAVLRQAVIEVAAIRLRGCTPHQLTEAIRALEPGLVHDVCQAVSVGETYFFRGPEQLSFLTEALADPLARGASFRAWSAGCATGEEAYSLSALLHARAGRGVAVEVLGSDLVARNLELARIARYGRWSVRRQTALAHAFHPLPDGRVEVDPQVRARVSFAQHNLLTPTPASFGRFHVILCRNVLVYFTREAAACAAAYLAEALTPEGLLVFGSMDLHGVPAGLTRVGPPELQLYRRSESLPALAPPRPAGPSTPARRPPARSKAKSSARLGWAEPLPDRAPEGIRAQVSPLSTQETVRSRAEPELPLGAASAEPVAVHLEALSRLEADDPDSADKLLEGLLRKVPHYLPGLLERALLHLRLGERQSGQRLMRDLLERSAAHELDEVLAAPEPVTVAFLRASAEAALRGVA